MMGSLQILAPLLAAAALNAPARAEPQCAAYAGELTAMVEAAEAVRSRIDYLASPGAAAAVQGRTELEAVERGNAERLGAWMNACGWPRRSVEGVQAARGAWLVAQQRSGDLPFQRQVVRQLELSVLDGEAPPMYLATASDRLAVREAGRSAMAPSCARSTPAAGIITCWTIHKGSRPAASDWACRRSKNTYAASTMRPPAKTARQRTRSRPHLSAKIYRINRLFCMNHINDTTVYLTVFRAVFSWPKKCRETIKPH
ncbi:hypothetical protein LPB04_05825 [Massilia litorea]|uniref:Lysozyme inhibitor LprI N-terminal domain-containing protein n=1 Tax=Massilia litorea TaxID=2769491 RepID=A0A7L9U6Z8_9BURK|nr:hypothetical protein [Massilia litorea]QOL50804.1 hypothetical protein LPB04_05825 [Massilia litorea]